MSAERRRLLARYGTELMLTPAPEGMTGAVASAEQLIEEHPDYFMPQQFQNEANPEIHRKTTAQEILDAVGGDLAALVAGVGTGGTITGVGEVLKQEIPDVQIIAVEPSRSPVLSGGYARPHGIQGIGASFVPGVLNRSVIDEIITVNDDDAFKMAGRLISEEGDTGRHIFWSQCLRRQNRRPEDWGRQTRSNYCVRYGRAIPEREPVRKRL